MADISITAANVAPTSTTQTRTGTAGETITAGQPVYLKAADSRLWKCDANASQATAQMVGIAMHGSLAGQPLAYATPGYTVTIGAALIVGSVYVLSVNAGGIAPAGDIATNSYTTVVGYAVSATAMYITGIVTDTLYAGAGAFVA